MTDYLRQLSAAARQAISRKEWAKVDACSQEILKNDGASAEGHFLSGMSKMASADLAAAERLFSRVLELDDRRYDAAMELARLHSTARRNGAAAVLLARYESAMQGSPHYLNLAGSIYSQIGMPEKAWPLLQRANELQPGVNAIESNLATAAVFLGKIEEAKSLFGKLLQRNPNHQRNQLSYARLEKATNREHIEHMQEILRVANQPPDRNIFMYYAIGKELEDLEEWDEAFKYFKMAGDAVCSVAEYDINIDLALIDKVMEVCSADWLKDGVSSPEVAKRTKTPIFIVGLPRTGTTLTDRIISSHSKVMSVGETQYMQIVLRRESGIESDEKMTPAMLDVTSKIDINLIGDGYMDMLDYRLGDEPMFVDKLPFNILYLGYIAKAFPEARLVRIKRNPMDSCFAMYKQVFTGAYKFSYSLEDLGRFYVKFDQLLKHWQETLGDRFIEVEYESLVADQENQTRHLLGRLGLDFEEACLNFDKSKTATATASSIQVREKIHSRSVNRWKNYEQQLQPLQEYLVNAGINVQ
jgi:tetratricopeptide (TPR) repeat protein